MISYFINKIIYKTVHPVAERHQRIQALMAFTRNIMKRTWMPMHERDELIENYCRQHWGLSQNAIRDYKKTALIQVQSEIESKIERNVISQLKVAPQLT